eukprot:COSAG01_NODE_11517_length_1916_cov_61.290323_3_plen_43_part_00
MSYILGERYHRVNPLLDVDIQVRRPSRGRPAAQLTNSTLELN